VDSVSETPRVDLRPLWGPAPPWMWIAITLLSLAVVTGLAILAFARNVEPSGGEAVQDVRQLVAELGTLNESLKTTNEILATAIANAAELSNAANVKLEQISTTLTGVDASGAQMRTLMGPQVTRDTRGELQRGQEQLQRSQGVLSQRLEQVLQQQLAALERDLGSGDRRAGTLEGRTGSLEGQIQGLDAEADRTEAKQAEVDALLAELQDARVETRARLTTLAAELRAVRRLQARLQARLDDLNRRNG